MSQIAKQMIVVSEGSYNENQLGEKVSLFNEDGSVFVAASLRLVSGRLDNTSAT